MLLYPVLLGACVAATWWGLDRIDGAALTWLVTAPLVLVLLGLERIRPERAEFGTREEPLRTELAHFLLGTELGTVIGLGAAVGLGLAVAAPVRDALGVHLWPTGLPVLAQVLLAQFLSDLAGYGQHRAFHAWRPLWRIHTVHHAVRRLYVVRTGRFHVIDFAVGTFAAYVPLVLLGAPDAMLVWTAILTGVLGVLQHANVRLPTPAWLDAILCTPAVHWRHHSRERADEGNYATSFMLIDRLFGTFVPTGGARPPRIGTDEPAPRGWRAQVLAPLRREPR